MADFRWSETPLSCIWKSQLVESGRKQGMVLSRDKDNW